MPEVRNLSEARTEYLRYVAAARKATTPDVLHDLIPMGCEDLENMPDKERRSLVADIQAKSRSENVTQLGANIGKKETLPPR